MRPSYRVKGFLLAPFFYLMLTGFMGGQTQETNPDFNLEGTYREFLIVFNTGEKEQIRNFVEEFYQSGINIEIETERWLRWYSVFGPVDPFSIEIKEENRLRVFTRGNLTKGWLELTFRRSVTEPGKLRNIAVGTGLTPKGAAKLESISSSKDLSKKTGNYLRRLEETDYFAGVVLIANGTEVVFSGAYGFANVSENRRNTLDTKFNIGSITKIFTALAIFQLVEAGKISLDDKAVHYLPDYPGELDKNITIRQLLTHTSGLGRGRLDDAIYPPSVREIDEWLLLTVAEPEFPPGENISYSNGAYVILGKIIEFVTGKNYFEVISDKIYKPAGMVSSGTFPQDIPEAGLATAYTHFFQTANSDIKFDSKIRRNAIFLNGLQGSPAGLSYSTANDLLSFFRALKANKLLSPTFTVEFQEPQVDLFQEVPSSQIESYGFGWEIKRENEVFQIGKSGGTWGVSARFDYFPQQDYVVIVLSNYDSIGLVVADYIRDLILE